MNEELEGRIVPHLMVVGGKAACTFYEKAFGAVTLFQHEAEDGERLMHASLNINGATVMLHDHFEEFGDAGGMQPLSPTHLPSVTIHIEVDDADTWWSRAVEAGCDIVFPLDNQFWGARYGKLRDPFGHIWSIGGPVTE